MNMILVKEVVQFIVLRMPFLCLMCKYPNYVLKRQCCVPVALVKLAQHSSHWWDAVKKEMNCGVSWKAGNLLANGTALSYQNRSLLHDNSWLFRLWTAGNFMNYISDVTARELYICTLWEVPAFQSISYWLELGFGSVTVLTQFEVMWSVTYHSYKYNMSFSNTIFLFYIP